MRLAGGRFLFLLLIAPGLTACATERVVVTEKVTEKVVEKKNMTHLEQCLLYANQGDFQNAIRECKRAVRDEPTAEAYANLGVAYIQVGKNNLALDALQKATALDPRDSFAQYNLCAVYSLMNRNDLALEALDAALDNGFNNADALRFDRDLDNVRGEPEFRTVLERHHIFIQ